MNARFYAPAAHVEGELATLPEDEAQHLMRVLRLKSGAEIRVFNGLGAEFDAVVERTTKKAVTVRLGKPRVPVKEPRVAVTLAQAVLKGDRMDAVVRDAVMMGVAAVQPLVSARSEVTVTTVARGRRRERWERVAVSSAKQCGRAIVPKIHEPCVFTALIQDILEEPGPLPALMLVEPGSSAASVSIHDVGSIAPSETMLLVGPEGGWTLEELGEASRVCQLITLGGRTLRADAASVVAIAALFALWNEL